MSGSKIHIRLHLVCNFTPTSFTSKFKQTHYWCFFVVYFRISDATWETVTLVISYTPDFVTLKYHQITSFWQYLREEWPLSLIRSKINLFFVKICLVSKVGDYNLQIWFLSPDFFKNVNHFFYISMSTAVTFLNVSILYIYTVN